MPLLQAVQAEPGWHGRVRPGRRSCGNAIVSDGPALVYACESGRGCAHDVPFGIPTGLEREAGLDVLACLTDGLEVSLRNDLVEVNLAGALLTARAAVKRMLPAGRGGRKCCGRLGNQ